MINPSLKECAQWLKNTPANPAREIRAGFMTTDLIYMWHNKV